MICHLNVRYNQQLVLTAVSPCGGRYMAAFRRGELAQWERGGGQRANLSNTWGHLCTRCECGGAAVGLCMLCAWSRYSELCRRLEKNRRERNDWINIDVVCAFVWDRINKQTHRHTFSRSNNRFSDFGILCIVVLLFVFCVWMGLLKVKFPCWYSACFQHAKLFALEINHVEFQ